MQKKLVERLFNSSLTSSVVPHQWKQASTSGT